MSKWTGEQWAAIGWVVIIIAVFLFMSVYAGRKAEAAYSDGYAAGYEKGVEDGYLSGHEDALNEQ